MLPWGAQLVSGFLGEGDEGHLAFLRSKKNLRVWALGLHC